MKHPFLLALILAVSLTACKKNTPPSTESVNQPAPRSASVENAAASDAPAPPAPASAPAEVAPEGNTPNVTTDSLPTAPDDTSLKPGLTDQKLTMALQYYVEANSKMPQNFQQLVAAKYIDKVPVPPPGKKFAIDRRHLQVVVIDK